LWAPRANSPLTRWLPSPATDYPAPLDEERAGLRGTSGFTAGARLGCAHSLARVNGGLLQWHEAFLRDDLLACGREDPVDVRFHFASRFARGIEIELRGDRVFSGAGHVHSGLDGRVPLLVEDFQPLDVGRLIPHAAIAQPGGGFGHVLEHYGGAVHFAYATSALALISVLL